MDSKDGTDILKALGVEVEEHTVVSAEIRMEANSLPELIVHRAILTEGNELIEVLNKYVLIKTEGN